MQWRKENKLFLFFRPTTFLRLFVFGVIIFSPVLLYFYQPILVVENKRPLSVEPDKEISLIFVGDIMLSRVIGKIIEEKKDWCFPFLQVADFLKSADITFGNLENPISIRGKNVGSIYSFRANPRTIEGLTCAGFDVLSLANNHAWDYGPVAFKDTLDFLKSANISPIGGGENYTDAHTAVVKDIRGTKIAFLGYTNLVPKYVTATTSTPAIAFAEAKQIKIDVTEAKKIADVVTVSFHFGEEYETVHNKAQEFLAHTAIDSGATLVIGHHPHVVEDDEEYNGGHIFYSLGNFVFDQNFSDDTKKGLAVKVTLKNKKVEKIEKIPVTFNSVYQPIVETKMNPAI